MPCQSLKVRVEDKLLLVPLPSSSEPLTVAWLAKEAARRYQRYVQCSIMHSLKYVLQQILTLASSSLVPTS